MSAGTKSLWVRLDPTTARALDVLADTRRRPPAAVLAQIARDALGTNPTSRTSGGENTHDNHR